MYVCLYQSITFNPSFILLQQCSIGLCPCLNCWSSWNIFLCISKRSSVNNSYMLHSSSLHTFSFRRGPPFFLLVYPLWNCICCCILFCFCPHILGFLKCLHLLLFFYIYYCLWFPLIAECYFDYQSREFCLFKFTFLKVHFIILSALPSSFIVFYSVYYYLIATIRCLDTQYWDICK